MELHITELQKRKIKEMVDEIIVSRGILAISDRQANVDGMDVDQLSRLAFKFYKMIYLGENPLDIDSTGNAHHNNRYKQTEGKRRRFCIGCGEPLIDDDIKNGMLVCRFCRSKLKTDYEVLKEMLHL